MHRKKMTVFASLLILLILALLIISKTIRPNLLLADRYEMRGVDVSHY